MFTQTVVPAFPELVHASQPAPIARAEPIRVMKVRIKTVFIFAGTVDLV